MSPPPPRRPDLDEAIVAVGQRVAPFSDVYAFLLRARWSTVVGLAAGAFLVLNLLFAILYWLVPGSVANADGTFLDAFYFSVQTFASIGYGFMYSQGRYANSIVALEAFTSLLSIAVVTGIVFAKFSRPHARVLFSQRCVIERRDGIRTLTFRVANERRNDVVEASIRVVALMTITTREGGSVRRFFDLPLERSNTPIFRMSWQLFHPITESSPIYGKTVEDLTRDDVRFVIALTDLDGTFAQTIHARHMYWPEEIVEGHRLVDVMEPLPDGRIQMDYRKFHEIEAEAQK